MQKAIISQITPYTCVLACLESFLTDLGYHVTQTEILTHHRDICQNPSDFKTYGAIDEVRLKYLAARYLCLADDFASQAELELSQQMAKSREALVACCHRFNKIDNLNHCIRLIGADQGVLHFLSPGFPHGTVESVQLVEFFGEWQPTVIRLSAR